MNTLYLLKTKGLGDFYVVASSATEAEKRLEELLDLASYGFRPDRNLVTIQILAQELTEFPKGKPCFSGEEQTLICHDTLLHLKK